MNGGSSLRFSITFEMKFNDNERNGMLISSFASATSDIN